MPKKKKEKIQSDLYCPDLDGTNAYDFVVEKNKSDNIVFSVKELETLKILVGYFHSYYYGRDKLGTFTDLKIVTDKLLKDRNQGIVQVLKDVSDEEYNNLWKKLI